MLSLLLPNRVAVGITAVLSSLVDKWEEGWFLDEIVEDLRKPFIKPSRRAQNTIDSLRYARENQLGKRKGLDGLPFRVPRSEDQELLEFDLCLLHVRARHPARHRERRPVLLGFETEHSG